MDQTTARPRAATTIRFEDGLGKRLQVVGITPEPLDVLVLKEELTRTPGFQEALRAQITRVATFRHPSFPQVKGIGRPPNKESGVAVISESVAGARLSSLLAAAGKRLLPLDAMTACWLTNELISAVASLHAALPGFCHGAIGPERIVITPDARLVVTDHVLGAALPKLGRSPAQCWREFRIALPLRNDTSSFDPRSDVAQIATVAMALMLAHPLGDDYPERIGGTSEDSSALSAKEALELLPDGFRSWMSRALQLGSEDPFESAIDAQADFNRMVQGNGSFRGAKASAPFMEGYHRLVSGSLQAPVAPKTPSSTDVQQIAPTSASAPAGAATKPTPVATPSESAPSEKPVVAAAPFAKWAAVGEATSTPKRRYLIAAAVLLLLITSGSAFAVRSRHSATSGEPAEGTLAVTTDPTGLAISIDGQPRGDSPLRVGVAAGNHVLEIKSTTDRRSVPVTVTAGTEVAQFIEMPKTAISTAPMGKLDIRTEPSGARVSVDGRRRGVSPISVEDVAPGSHTVTVESDRGTVTEEVTVRSGATSSLILPLSPAAAPAPTATSGWIAVVAPAEVQVFENKRLLGTSSTDRIVAPPGKHDLEIVSDVLGFREQRTVTVTANQASTVTLNWPKGSLALNAQPWAEVWLDGDRVGETPLGDLSVPIGPHDVVFRHPELGEQRFKAVVTLAGPARLTADLRKK